MNLQLRSHGSMRPLERRDICAVVVTFFPRPDHVDHLRALAPQVGKIVIVDNGSAGPSLQYLQDAARTYGALVLRMGRNAGIAAALNAGLAHAREHGYPWLLTLDQDSEPTPAMVAEMAAALTASPESARVAVLAPQHIDRRLGMSGVQREMLAAELPYRPLITAMTSGNLVAIEAAAAIGGWEEKLFIDFVDHEFCLRLRRHGWRILHAPRARLRHSLGRMELPRLLGRAILVTHHSPARRYYISRNRMILWRRYWRTEPAWCAADLRHFLRETLGIVTFEEDSRRKIWMTVRGMVDAFRDLKGPLET